MPQRNSPQRREDLKIRAEQQRARIPRFTVMRRKPRGWPSNVRFDPVHDIRPLRPSDYKR